MEYLVNEKRNNQLFPGNCIYIPENYPENWRGCQLRGRRRAV